MKISNVLLLSTMLISPFGFASDKESVADLNLLEVAYSYKEFPLSCAPSFVCSVRLRPDENITYFAVGDPDNWNITPADKSNIPLVFVEPGANADTTNLVIVTDKRTYLIRPMISTDMHYTYLSFSYGDAVATE